MKRTSFFAIGFVFVFAFTAAAQRTVTNNDLEKYRENRVRAEQQMRENYARLGFPSPDEMARRDEESTRTTIELADKIRRDRLEQERLNAQYWSAVAAANANQRPIVIVTGENGGDYFVQYGYGFGRGFRFGNRFNQPLTPYTNGYFAGGQFWSGPSRTIPMPVFRRH